MSKPRLLDLYCGAGGAAKGYQRAGFYVIGVDHKPQPRYCGDEFYQDDAMTFPLFSMGFDAFHASPPCQRYSNLTPDPKKHPDLYIPTKTRLIETGKPYVIENVITAPFTYGIVLCGSMFDLSYQGEWLQRHRNFETSFMMFQPPCHHPHSKPISITGNSFVKESKYFKHGESGSRQTTFDIAQHLMGIDWMTRAEITQAIPPAYTEYIGKHLMNILMKGSD